MNSTRRLLAVTAGALAAGLVAGCSQPSFAFRQDDPIGYTACRDAVAAQAMDAGDEFEELMGTIAAAAAASETGDIRDTVSPPVDPEELERVGAEDDRVYSVDVDELLEACEGVGFAADDVEVE